MLALANLLGRSEHMKHAFFLHTGYGKTKLILDKIMNTIPHPRVLLISIKISSKVRGVQRLKMVSKQIDIRLHYRWC